MDLQEQGLMALRVLGAALLGALIGWERETHGRDAGVRTHAAVSVGASVFALISVFIGADRIAAGVVAGVGFIGAGVIMQDRGSIVGLTTAATLWATSSVGLLVGYGLYVLAALVSVIIIGLLALQRLPLWNRVTRPIVPVIRDARDTDDDRNTPAQ
jgi:putative Mg2+ transporter-C (MgtC) family protein